MEGLDQIWVFGDEFADHSFTEHMRHARDVNKDQLFTFQHFEVFDYTTNRYSSSLRSIIARIRALVQKAITERKYLPKAMVMVFDDDIIKQLHFTQYENIEELKESFCGNTSVSNKRSKQNDQKLPQELTN